jgi:hypothetical protein
VTSVFVTAFRHERCSAWCWCNRDVSLRQLLEQCLTALVIRQNKAEGARFDALAADIMKKICKLNALLKVIVMVRRFKNVLSTICFYVPIFSLESEYCLGPAVSQRFLTRNCTAFTRFGVGDILLPRVHRKSVVCDIM